MTIILFLIILSVLVFVHELGHFLVAKKSGIRVDEFGFGYPPRAKKLFTWRGTDVTLNWLPFGGFVKIFGENPEDSNKNQPGSFNTKNRGIQSAVLVAGAAGNLIFAWILMSLGLVVGMPAPQGFNLPVENVETVVTGVVPDSPATLAGLRSGDVIVGAHRGNVYSDTSPEQTSNFISASSDPVTLDIVRGKNELSIDVSPQEGIVEGRLAIGISMDEVGIVRLAPHKALYHGLILTSRLTYMTARALIAFIGNAIVGKGDFTQVTGPVGLVGIVGDVSELGLAYIISLTALISINLAIINLFPFPALDGGRLLFVIIEAIRRKAIPSRVFNIVNTLGFAFLIFLMILVTIRDVRNIL
jgi:regulator of sigma E protease